MASPHAAGTLEDLMTYGSGLDLIERPVTKDEVGLSPRERRGLVVTVSRGKKVLAYKRPEAGILQGGDRLVAISQSLPKR
jgi:voltage-gated potassium channel